MEDLTPDQILNRDLRAEQDVEEVVDAIIADVRGPGGMRPCGITPSGSTAPGLEELEVSAQEMNQALADADPYFLDTLRMAAANIEAFHRRQLRDSFVMTEQDGVILGQKYTPVERAGVYVPGGTAAYPSTVLMDVIPARGGRGVPEIVMVTPAGRDGRVAPANPGGGGGGRRHPHLQGRRGRRRWRPLPMAPRACRRWTRSWAPATSMWPPPSARSTARWAST